MVAIKWTEAMSVGVPLLDRDHKILVGLINRMSKAGEEGGDVTRALIDVLATLLAYTVYHFGREEEVMEACGYPDLPTHRGEHFLLTREVEQLDQRFLDNPEAIGRDEVVSFLTGWLNHHILLQDKAYRPFVENNPKAEAAARAYGDFDFAPFALGPDYAAELDEVR